MARRKVDRYSVVGRCNSFEHRAYLRSYEDASFVHYSVCEWSNMESPELLILREILAHAFAERAFEPITVALMSKQSG
jgi:hypothetical protein